MLADAVRWLVLDYANTITVATMIEGRYLYWDPYFACRLDEDMGRIPGGDKQFRTSRVSRCQGHHEERFEAFPKQASGV